MKRISIIFVFSIFTACFLSPADSIAQGDGLKRLGGSIFGKKSGGIGKIKRIRAGAKSSECGKWLKRKKLRIGKNKKRDGSSRFFAISEKRIQAPPGSPGFIDDRYIAFREAMMEAKGKMVGYLETSIKSEAKSRIQSGQFSSPSAKNPNKTVPPPSGADGGLSGVFDKAMKLLNIKLDKGLKENGHDPQAKEESARRKAAAAAEKILASRDFSELIEATAKNKLKGVFARYAFENIPPGTDGSVCVVAQYSSKSERLADAMAARDFSAVPRSRKKRAPLELQVPADDSDEGIQELLTAFGISVMLDENGDYNIVSYAQAEIQDVNNDIMVEAAMGQANIRAEASIRRFVNESVVLRKNSETARSVKDFKDKMRTVTRSSAYMKQLEEKSEAFPINGILQIREWAALHPVSEQGIAGAVVAWNASSAAEAITDKKRLNQIPADTGGKSQSSSGSDTIRRSTDRKAGATGKSFRGGKKDSEEDF